MAGILVSLPFLFASAFFFWWASIHWNRAKLIVDTPTTAIGRLPAGGRVEVKGRARATRSLHVWGTRLRCAWYRLVVCVLEGFGRSTHAVIRTDETSHDLIAVEDGTGTILVDPDGADVLGSNPLAEKVHTAPGGALEGLAKAGGAHLSTIPEGAKVYVLGWLRRSPSGRPVLKATPEHPLVIRVGSEEAELGRERSRGMGLVALALVQLTIAALIIF